MRDRLRSGAAHAPAIALAVWPVLFLAGNNPGEFGVADVVVTSLVAGIVGALCALAGAAICGRGPAGTLGGIVLVGAFYLPVIAEPLRANDLLGMASNRPLVPVLLTLVAALGIARLRRAGDAARALARPAAIACLALAAMAAVQAARSAWRSRPPAAPAIARGAPAHDSLPDIYLIVVDQYATGGVLRWRFGLDNRPFEDSLRARGFVLPRATWSNYAFTAASVASLLDMRHVAALADSVPPGDQSLVAFNRIIADNAAFRIAREKGYRVVFVPSAGFQGTRDHEGADRVLRGGGPATWLAEHATSPLAIETAKLSVIGSALEVARMRAGSPWRELAPFRGLAAAVAEPGPKLVFAHAMTTHEPFLFTGDCGWLRGRWTTYAEGYGEQLRCTNRQLWRVLDAIERSPRKSVVLIQSDHGTGSLGSQTMRDARGLTAAQAAERFGAFSAYRLPGGGALADTVTPVNLLRLVYNRHLGTSLALLPNDAYHGVVSRTYDFVPVDPRVLGDTVLVSSDAGSGVRATGRALASAALRARGGTTR